MIVQIRDVEGDPRVRILRQMFNEGSLDIQEFGFRLRQVKDSY